MLADCGSLWQRGERDSGDSQCRIPDGSSYYRKADETLGMTAKQFRHGGENLAVRYALADCELGRCLVAESERGFARYCWAMMMRH